MEQIKEDEQPKDPAFLPERDIRKDLVGRPFFNQWQFEEAVQKLQEEFEKHPKPPTGTFY